jgi:hypothetical protein
LARKQAIDGGFGHLVADGCFQGGLDLRNHQYTASGGSIDELTHKVFLALFGEIFAASTATPRPSEHGVAMPEVTRMKLSNRSLRPANRLGDLCSAQPQRCAQPNALHPLKRRFGLRFLQQPLQPFLGWLCNGLTCSHGALLGSELAFEGKLH